LFTPGDSGSIPSGRESSVKIFWPSIKNLKAACRDLGIDKRKAVLLGDQLLTDCAAAKRFGIKAIIVPPIKDKTTLFFKSKRLIEKPYVAKFKRMNEK
jgi:predicted HAD superfamily phosphohydrolase YqeG